MIAGALAWLVAAAPVSAADIPVAPIAKAPIYVPPPKQPWYGFHIGVHGGYGWSRDSVDFAPDPAYELRFLLGSAPRSLALDSTGFIAGVQWGSSWQFDRVVLGTDSDFSYTDIKGTASFAGTFVGLPVVTSAEQRLKWFGTTRLRGGILVTDNILLYATGGLAAGRVESSASSLFTGFCAVPSGCPTGSAAKDKYGWTVGGGIELADGPWMFRVEYLHYDLGTLNYVVADPLLPGFGIATSARFAGDIVRGGVSYRFNWTPWELIFGR